MPFIGIVFPIVTESWLTQSIIEILRKRGLLPIKWAANGKPLQARNLHNHKTLIAMAYEECLSCQDIPQVAGFRQHGLLRSQEQRCQSDELQLIREILGEHRPVSLEPDSQTCYRPVGHNCWARKLSNETGIRWDLLSPHQATKAIPSPENTLNIDQ